MVRFIDDGEIRQKSKSEMFNATDLLKIINKKRIIDNLYPLSMSNYTSAKQNKEFIEALMMEEGLTREEVIKTNKKAGSWVHPLVLIDMALWGYPKLKVAVYKWMYDNLLKYRNDSGDSFKEMNEALDDKFNIGAKYWEYAQVANMIADEIGLKNIKNRWQIATEQQLRYRDYLQHEIIGSANYGNNKTLDECVKKAIDVFRVKVYGF